jgi:light-regulated signal transduction histidine kinase (bacteriophytochrome)
MEQTPLLKEGEIGMQHQGATSLSALEKDYAEFIDMAVHDLDAPLRKLSLLIGMFIEKLTPDKDTQVYIERIENCVGDMRSLIDDLSVLAKVTSGKREHTSFKLENIIQQSLRELPLASKEREAVVNMQALPVIEGDADQYCCLFKNLLDNAIKFSKKDSVPEIEIRSSVLKPEEKVLLDLSDDRSYYKIEITDNGIGFKKDYSEKIFRPFVRLHGKSQFPGSGMGLAICKKIMNIHHGLIYAESLENEGARFTLVLPETHC